MLANPLGVGIEASVSSIVPNRLIGRTMVSIPDLVAGHHLSITVRPGKHENIS